MPELEIISFIKMLHKILNRLRDRLAWIPYLLTGRFFRAVRETRRTSAPISWRIFWRQKICGRNLGAAWPVSPDSIVGNPEKIKIGVGCAPGLGPWCYIQGANGIEIGDYTLVAPRVSIISANHDVYDIHSHVAAKPVKIGCYCWLGINSTILPEVEIGDHTVVAAGSVVTKSFPDGYCVLAGVPAKIVKRLDVEKVVEWRNRVEYIGYQRVGTRG